MISSGTGPQEVRAFVLLLARRVQGICSREGLRIDAIALQGPPSSPRSVRVSVVGEPTASLLAEVGSHALVAPSTRGRRGRKRWFASIAIWREEDVGSVPPVRDSDLQTTTFRSRGPGGQHVNRSATAVRMRHLPTGITVRAETERSQRMNRETAKRRIQERLVRQAHDRQRRDRNAERSSHYRLERGAPVRVYALNDRGELESRDER
jgi:protein subunit release factor B